VSVAGNRLRRPTTPARASYDIDFIGPAAGGSRHAAREGNVCSVRLRVLPRRHAHARGEATDLRRSALVGADINGDRIVALLRAGIPQTAKLSPMPQFSDLSDRQLHDIARLHPLRAQEKLDTSSSSTRRRRRRRRGREGATSISSAPRATRMDRPVSLAATTRRRCAIRLLRPPRTQLRSVVRCRNALDAKRRRCARRHNHLLENYTPTLVANLVAYLITR
jgi:hypothetical protein